MDGYAVRFEDVQHSSPDRPTALRVVAEIPAGTAPQGAVHHGEAARILTGSMLPPGADTVVMQEETQREGDRVLVLAAPRQAGQFVRYRASYYQAGNVLLPAGVRLSASDMAVLAAAQCTSMAVYRRLRVAVLSTGDELVNPDQPLQPGQIVDSNRYAIAALLQAAGAEPLAFGPIPDRPEPLKEAIANALTGADVILSSGGVSVGDYDYVESVLESLGATLHIRSVAVKPGKPLTVATFPHNPQPILYVGLPGNPASAFVGFWRFVLPALSKRAGLAADWGPMWLQGRSLQDLQSDGKRETYLWGRVQSTAGELVFQLAGGSHGSGNLINLAQTNALAVLPVGTTRIAAGDAVTLMLLTLA